MYNIDETTGVQSSYLAPGIHQDVKIVDIVKENSKKDGTGKEVLRFYFEGKDGGTFNHTEFSIDPEQTKKMAEQWGNDPKEAVTNAVNDLGARIKHILSAFMPAENVVIHVATWEEYCDKVVEICGTLYKDQLFRLKLVLNNKDYTILPKKTFSPFIQNMEAKDTLAIVPKYDRIVAKAPTEEALYDAVDDTSDDTFEDEF